VAGEITPRNPVTHTDDPAITATGGINKTRWNQGMKLTGGNNKQLVERDTSADGTTGLNLTSTPSVDYLIFAPAVDPDDLPDGGFTIVEAAGVTTFWYRRISDSVLVSTEMGS
jgi:hypothetical protein